MEVKNNSLVATFAKFDVGKTPIEEVENDGVTASNINNMDTQTRKTISISEAMLVVGGNGSGNEPPTSLGSSSRNIYTRAFGNGSGNEPP